MIVQGLPHTRGGVSLDNTALTVINKSSPHTWGCFTWGCFHEVRLSLPHTRGGVSPDPQPDARRSGLPHTRGGVSVEEVLDSIQGASSPHTWGCFHEVRLIFLTGDVFPTHVGCFSLSLGAPAGGKVFPTHVGVFPRLPGCTPRSTRLPHTRGGVSRTGAERTLPERSSPHTWGCFLKPYSPPAPSLPCSRPYPAKTAGRAAPANAGFGKALSNHPATGNPPRRSCGKSGVWAAWLQALPVPAFRAGAEASLPAWAARRAFLPLRPAPHV